MHKVTSIHFGVRHWQLELQHCQPTLYDTPGYMHNTVGTHKGDKSKQMFVNGMSKSSFMSTQTLLSVSGLLFCVPTLNPAMSTIGRANNQTNQAMIDAACADQPPTTSTS